MKGTTYSPARFKPTYKGWKLWTMGVLLLPGNRFKPTYKGWKLPSAVILFASPLVLSLPTRDGNMKRQKKALNYRQVLSLPTRDGNTAK